MRGTLTIRAIATLSICLLALILTPHSRASESAYTDLASEGIELAYNLHFDAATDVFDQLIERFPEHPRGYLLRSVVFYYRTQLEEDHDRFSLKFLQAATDAISVAKKTLAQGGDRREALFSLGTTHIYLAAYYGWDGHWWKAYRYGKQGIETLKRLIQHDPDYYDAYLGLGLYHYYTDVIPRFAKAVTFLLGIDSDRERGLRELRLAAEKGTYSRAEATLFLGSIHLYIEKNYATALGYFERLATLYPDNSSFLMLLGENYQKVGRPADAARTLSRLVDETVVPQFPVLVISSYYRLGNLYFGMRDLPKAIQSYKRSLALASSSTGNVNWVFALANLNLGRSFDLLGRPQEAMLYYKRVKRSDHKHAYEIAQAQMRRQGVKERPGMAEEDDINPVYQ
ncbi:MAG: tetratricopeptide repeat protein [Nitrospinales bacterium]